MTLLASCTCGTLRERPSASATIGRGATSSEIACRPWRSLITMRHRSFHGYIDGNDGIVWDTVK